MPLLPVELIEEIIDIVADSYPESLADCALVSHQWHPRSTHHLYRIFRTPTITTFGALHTFSDIVERRPRLATIATSLEIAPDLQLDSAHASYIPFHRLSSRILPNVLRLVLGKNLRWNDYPLVYRRGTVAGFFTEVIALDLSCHFRSVSDLFRVIRSFRNVKEVRLLYSHHYPPRWMFYQTHIPLPRHIAFFHKTFRLQNLELSLAVLKPVLDVCGDFVVNLSVRCPKPSAIPMNAVEGDNQVVLMCSLTSLRKVKITVPVESDGATNYVRYPMAVDASAAQLQENIRICATTSPDIAKCSECHPMKKRMMLNGRVYGAKRNPNAQNPFANVRTDEPEFVEWGYGGMGSVKNTAGQSSVWSRLQATNNATGIARKANDDEDDGSGMAWVRRRKAERERAKREAEERAKKEQEVRENTAEANAYDADVEMTAESEVTDAKETDTEAADVEPVERNEKANEAENAPTSPNATVTSAPAPSTPLVSEG